MQLYAAFNVCKSTRLGVSLLQKINGTADTHIQQIFSLRQPFSSCVRLYKCACEESHSLTFCILMDFPSGLMQ